jgi:transposase
MESIVAVGIDVAKEKLDVAVFNGKKFVTRIYPNTKEGIERFLEDVEEKYVEISKDSIHFVMEATGSYNTKVLYAISDRGYPVYVLNPIVSRRYSEEQMKRTVTDKEVSKLLAGYAYSSILSFKSGIPSESYNTLMSFKFDSSKKDNLELRILIKTLESLMRTRTRILNEIEALNQYPDGFVDSVSSA